MDEEILNKFIDFLDVNKMDENNENILHHVARNGNLNILKKLILKFDIDNLINRQNNTGETPLHISAKNNHNDFSQMLINNGADKNIKDINGNTVKFDNRMFGGKNLKKYYGTRKL